MAYRRRWFATAIITSLLVAFSLPAAEAQNSGRTVRRYQVADDPNYGPAVAQAEAAVERKDYAAAEQQLKKIVAGNSSNYRAWFDLGTIYDQTHRMPEAIDAFRKSVEANPRLFESTLNLGLLLARTGQPDAEKYLRAATGLQPSSEHPEKALAQAWLALGRVLEANDAAQALVAYQRAAELQPKEFEFHLLAARTAERAQNWTVAEAQYTAALQVDPKSSDASRGLIGVYLQSKQWAKAEAALRQSLQVDPHNAFTHLQLGRVLATEGKKDAATAELEAGLSAQNDPEARRVLVQLYIDSKQYDQATQQLQLLLHDQPSDAELRAELGNVLLRQRRYAEAQQELLAALKLKPDLGEAYGDLALSASEMKNYALTIRALDARARLLPEVPATYFLRAVAYDHLQDKVHAAENYRRFLDAARGQFPDQEFQARHRLEALDPKK